jgi:transcriptional regulator NrdR family protein
MKNCPKCGSSSVVTDSRPHDDTIRRTRRCRPCKAVWYTVEVVDEGSQLSLRRAVEEQIRRLKKVIDGGLTCVVDLEDAVKNAGRLRASHVQEVATDGAKAN